MDKVINPLDLIDYIENFGKDFEYYRIYFKDRTVLIYTEKEFLEQDKIYNGELALKVIN